MPRYRFKWENIPEDLLVKLAEAAGTSGRAPSTELRQRFGARPKDEFVHELWPTLRESWLLDDGAARASVVATLRDAGIGGRPGDDTTSEIEYLRSVRNAKTLRSVVLSAFHALGEKEQAEGARGGTTANSATAADAAPSRIRVSRPRRKYVNFDMVQESPEGQEFVAALVTLVGEPDVRPLGKIRDAHLFAASGEKARALIVVLQEEKGLNHTWTSSTAFQTDGSPPVEAVLQTSRWSPWLEFDAKVVKEASRKQRRDWDADRIARAANSDSLAIRQLTLAAARPELLDLSAAEVAACWALIDEQVSESQSRTPPGAPTVASKSEPALTERSQTEQVAERVLHVLRNASGNPELEPDDSGEVALRFGSTVVFVRVFGEPPVVRVYAPVLGKVTHSKKVNEAVNDLNRSTGFTKWILLDNTIIAAIDLFGQPVIEAHVTHAVQVVGETADGFDEQLQAKLGGKTFFGDYSKPKLKSHHPGYL